MRVRTAAQGAAITCAPERSKMRSAVRLNSDVASAEAASDVLVIPLPAKMRDAGVIRMNAMGAI